MSNGRGEGIAWFKIVMFGLVALMLAGIASIILDSGLGRPDEARRLKHPAGFSIIQPQGWGGTVTYRTRNGPDGMRLAPERVAGRQTVITVVRLPRAPKLDPAAKEVTFQDKPAWATFKQFRRDAEYRLEFQRGDAWFSIAVGAPIALDWDRDPIMDFVRTFRTEAVTAAPVVPGLPAEPGTEPATGPTTEPAAVP